MNFCNNLQKLRKNKNISQEQLAEELGVSRQAVSKWESGASYPEMDKLVLLCKIFNCNLDDLINKDITQIEDLSSSKKILTNFIKSIGDGITKTIKMIENFSFKDLVKFIIQILVIVLVIAICRIPFSLVEDAIYNILVKYQNNIICNVFLTFFEFIISIGYSVFAIITFFYIYKVKFLNEVEVINKESNKKTSDINKQTKSSDKYIIKSNKMTILEFLTMLLIWFLKFMVIVFMIPTLISLLTTIVCFTLFIVLLFKGLLLTGPILITISLIVFGVVLLEIMFNFIVNKKSNYKRVFIAMISSITVFGIGVLFSMIYFSDLKLIDKTSPKFKNKKMEQVISMNDSLFIYNYNGNINYEVDPNLSNDEVKLTLSYYSNTITPKVNKNDDNTYSIGVIQSKYFRMQDYTDDIINNLKKKRVYTYYGVNDINVSVFASEENINKIKENYYK